MTVLMKRAVLICLTVLLTVPSAMLAVPELDFHGFCKKLMGDREGMWPAECRSVEQDCLTSLTDLEKGNAQAVRSCTATYAGMQSYCAILLCASPDEQAAKDALLTNAALPELMSEYQKK